MEWDMLIGGKYEVTGPETEADGWRTSEARDVTNGRVVRVHRLAALAPGSPQPSREDLARRCGHVIDTCTSEGVEYVVTEELLPATGTDRFTRVGAWRVPASFSAKPAPPAPPPESGISGMFESPPTSAPGSFTRMFQPADDVLPPVAQASSASEVAPPPGPADDVLPPVAPAAPEPGEFTRMFQAQAPPQAVPASPVNPPASAPGEFTRMFRANSGGAPPSPPAAPPAPAAPAPGTEGEFTKFFHSPLQESTAGPAPVYTPEPAPAAPQPGEYTRLFRSPAPAAPEPARSGATGAFLATSAPAPAAAPPVADGPSDFTRMIQSSPPPPPAPAAAVPAQPSAPPAAARPGVPPVLVALLGALAVLAIGIILFFALRHR